LIVTQPTKKENIKQITDGEAKTVSARIVARRAPAGPPIPVFAWQSRVRYRRTRRIPFHGRTAVRPAESVSADSHFRLATLTAVRAAGGRLKIPQHTTIVRSWLIRLLVAATTTVVTGTVDAL